MEKPFYQYELDLLRIVGVVNIVLFHYTFRGYAADNMSALSFPVLGEIFKYGFLGIYLFFIISGYTMTLSAYRKDFRSFVVGRIVRLYPVFWAAVCITTLASIILQSHRFHVEWNQFLVNLTMISAFFGVKSVDGAYWFMFVIIRFYFLISILILFNLMRFTRIIAGAWLFLSILLTFHPVPVMGLVFIPSHAPFLISGMILYSAKKTGWDGYGYFIFITSSLFSFYLLFSEIPGFNNHYSTNLNLPVVFGILFLIYSAMYRISRNSKMIKRPNSLAIFSACTYPLYLIHQNFGFMIFNKYGRLVDKYMLLTLTFLLMVFLALIIVKYIDPYMSRAMNKVLLPSN